MDRLTREGIEDVWLTVKRLYENSQPNVYPAMYERLRKPFDLALQSLSQEAVRDEALEEAARVCDGLLTPLSAVGFSLGQKIRALKREPNAAEPRGVYCHECSKAGGADKPIYHKPPVCTPGASDD